MGPQVLDYGGPGKESNGRQTAVVLTLERECRQPSWRDPQPEDFDFQRQLLIIASVLGWCVGELLVFGVACRMMAVTSFLGEITE